MTAKKKNIEKEFEAMSIGENTPVSNEESGSLMDDFANAGSGSAEGDEMLDMSTDDVFDETTHPTGTEVNVRIVSVASGFSEKSEADYWRLILEDTNDPHVKRMSFFLGFLSKTKKDVRKDNNTKKAFMNFKKAFGLSDGAPVSKNALPGLTAWCVVRRTESEQYGEQNEVSRWIIPGNQG